MNVLYSLYISKHFPKHFKEKSPLPIIIGDFLSTAANAANQFEIVISPGFLGTAQNFFSVMGKIFSQYVSQLVLYQGMVGASRLQDNVRAFNGFFQTVNGVSSPTASGYFTTKKDHRKMIFFRRNCDTEAVLIGSSNFSNNTYLEKNKGEADLFLFFNRCFSRHCERSILNVNTPNNRGDYVDSDTQNDNIYYNCVLSRSIAMNTAPETYLNDIYDEFTNNA